MIRKTGLGSRVAPLIAVLAAAVILAGCGSIKKTLGIGSKKPSKVTATQTVTIPLKPGEQPRFPGQRVISKDDRIKLLEAEVVELKAEVEELKTAIQAYYTGALKPPGPATPAAPKEPASKPGGLTPAKQPEPVTKVPTRTAATPTGPGRFGVHLASFREAEAATGGWKKLASDYPNLLGVLSAKVKALDLPNLGGTYYRLKAGPFATDQMAKEVCEELEKVKQYCIVTIFDGQNIRD